MSNYNFGDDLVFNGKLYKAIPSGFECNGCDLWVRHDGCSFNPRIDAPCVPSSDETEKAVIFKIKVG